MVLLGLKGYADERAYTLSGGTKRKVMLARAFITEPTILVLDEPTSGLDPVVREVVWERILRFKKSGRTVLLSTHHFEEAKRLCDRIGIIHQGKFIARNNGTTDIEEVFKEITDTPHLNPLPEGERRQ